MAKKKTFEDVKTAFESMGYELLETEYINCSAPMKYKCPNHNTEIKTISYQVISRGQGCRDCGYEKVSRKMSRNLSEVKMAFGKRGYELLEKCYSGNKTKMRYKCPKHPDKELSIRFNDLDQGQGCPYCAGKKVDFEDVQKFFSQRNCTLISTEYKAAKDKLLFMCKVHSQEIQEVTWDNFNGSVVGCKYCGWNKRTENISGRNHYNYDEELTDEERYDRRLNPEYQKWRTDVYNRDDFTCSKCSCKGGKLIAHHLDGFHWCKEKRHDVSNGITLCKNCHKEFHSVYGIRNNTKDQYEEWMKKGLIGDVRK